MGSNPDIENGNCREPTPLPIVITDKLQLKLSNGICMCVDYYNFLWFHIHV